MATKPELSTVEYAAVRALAASGEAMQRAAEALVALPSLNRATAIAYIEEQRRTLGRDAEALAGMDGISDAHEALRRYDASLRCLGRLLYFLHFGKCPTDATAEERALCERLGVEIANSERQGSPRVF